MTSPDEIARGIAPCWGDGIAGPKECDEVYQCELHFRLAAALAEYGDKAVAEYAKASVDGWRKRFIEADAEGYRRGVKDYGCKYSPPFINSHEQCKPTQGAESANPPKATGERG